MTSGSTAKTGMTKIRDQLLNLKRCEFLPFVLIHIHDTLVFKNVNTKKEIRENLAHENVFKISKTCPIECPPSWRVIFALL